MSAPTEIKLSGTVSHLLSQDANTGFCIARLNVPALPQEGFPEPLHGRREVTVTGVLHGAKVGDRVRVVGAPKEHPKYGWQVSATRMVKARLLQKATPDLIIKSRFLGRLSREDIQRAKRIFPDLASQLSNNQMPGGKKDSDLCRRLDRAWQECQPLRAGAGFLNALGLGPDTITRVIAVYGKGVIDQISQSPYRLLGVPGIGFKTADDLAVKMGLDSQADARLSQSMDFMIRQARSRGNTIISPRSLIDGASNLTGNDKLTLSRNLQQSIQKGRLSSGTGFVGDASLVSLEIGVAKQIKRRTGPVRQLQPGRLDFALYDEQNEAVNLVLGQNVSILTGGPGVGKTTVVRALVGGLEALGGDILLAAPSAKAARRMSEATGRPAKTLHQLLEFNGASGFGRNEQNMLDGSVLIIDEASMVDITMISRVLRAMPEHMRLILVGDKDQLPSIDAGNVLADLVASGAVPTARLLTPRRQDKGSNIIEVAHRILRGEMPDLDRDGDFRFIQASEPEAILRQIEGSLKSTFSHLKFGVSGEGAQVLSPQNTQAVGVRAINKRLQESLNPQPTAVSFFGESYRCADPIMQMENDYRRGMMNGQTGVIVHADRMTQQVLARFDGRIMPLRGREMAQVRLGYAATVHKSQGSEYDAVLMPISSLHQSMLTRQSIYTAITRGKKGVHFIGEPEALEKGLADTRDADRQTLLCRLLREGPEPGLEVAV